VEGDYSEEFEKLVGKPLDVDVKIHREKRSRNANNYMWQLCEKIAVENGCTKEDVYRKNLREVGVYEAIYIKPEGIEQFKEEWSKKGIGWFAEEVDDCKNFKLMFVYYGSSTYTTSQMSRLIDAVVQDAKSCGIATETPEELHLMLQEWGR
jgi:hypothetical protein